MGLACRSREEGAASLEAVQKLQQDLAERQGEVDSLKADVARLEQALQEAPDLLADKDAQLARLQVPAPLSRFFPSQLSSSFDAFLLYRVKEKMTFQLSSNFDAFATAKFQRSRPVFCMPLLLSLFRFPSPGFPLLFSFALSPLSSIFLSN